MDSLATNFSSVRLFEIVESRSINATIGVEILVENRSFSIFQNTFSKFGDSLDARALHQDGNVGRYSRISSGIRSLARTRSVRSIEGEGENHCVRSEHRRILSDELTSAEKKATDTTASTIIPILPSQLAFGKTNPSVIVSTFGCSILVFLETGLPYIGFGFVDNFVMLVAVSVRLFFLSLSHDDSFREKPSKRFSAQRFAFRRWPVNSSSPLASPR